MYLHQSLGDGTFPTDTIIFGLLQSNKLCRLQLLKNIFAGFLKKGANSSLKCFGLQLPTSTDIINVSIRIILKINFYSKLKNNKKDFVYKKELTFFAESDCSEINCANSFMFCTAKFADYELFKKVSTPGSKALFCKHTYIILPDIMKFIK